MNLNLNLSRCCVQNMQAMVGLLYQSPSNIISAATGVSDSERTICPRASGLAFGECAFSDSSSREYVTHLAREIGIG